MLEVVVFDPPADVFVLVLLVIDGLGAPPPDEAPQLPTGAAGLSDTPETSGPGDGNFTSYVSRVLQPLLTLATNIRGRAEKEVARAEIPG